MDAKPDSARSKTPATQGKGESCNYGGVCKTPETAAPPAGTDGSCCGGGTGTSKRSARFLWVPVVILMACVVYAMGTGKKGQPSRAEKGGVGGAMTATTAPVPGRTPEIRALRPKLLDLGADKCIPCKMMAPILEEMRTAYADTLDVVFIDVWKNPAEAKKYGVAAIPTQIFFDAQGKELFRHEGFFAKDDILAKWKEFGVDLAAKDAAPISAAGKIGESVPK